MLKIPVLEKIELPPLRTCCNTLPLTGVLTYRNRDYAYLKVSDDFIYKLYPILSNAYPTAQMPNYFGDDGTGAHMTIIYSNENTILPEEEFKQSYDFTVLDSYRTLIDTKLYYILLVKSEGLTALRKKYLLPEKLNFKGYAIDFHITIASEIRV